MNDNPDWAAPAGQTWVCAACGKNGKLRDRIGDESCFLNAVLCWAEKKDGHWVAVPGGQTRGGSV